MAGTMSDMECHGNGVEHCCWAGGGECEFLETGETGRRRICGLRRRLGSWDAVHASAAYQASPIGRHMATAFPGYGCGDFPQHIPAVMAQTSGRCCWEPD